MKILTLVTLFLMSAICYGQDRFIKESDIENAHIKKGIVLYDTLEKGQGGAFRFILTDFGTVDTTKLIIVKYEAFQIDAGTQPPTIQVDTVDSEGLTFSSIWTRHGLTNATGWYKRTISYSNVGEVSYTFTGTKIEVFGERGLTNGSATITIGNVTQTVSFKGERLLPYKTLSFTVPRGTYPVVIKPNGDGNILIDYIIVTK